MCVCVCVLGCLLTTGRIMQGLGKTERGEQGRDIDLTSLRSTMPASGPLQVSAPIKQNKTIEPATDRSREKVLHLLATLSLSSFCFPFPVPISSALSSPFSLFGGHSESPLLYWLYHRAVVCPAYVRAEDQRDALWARLSVSALF